MKFAGGAFSGDQRAVGLGVLPQLFRTLDGGVFYKVNDKLTVGLEGINLTDTPQRQLMEQHIGMMGRAWFKAGRRYATQVHNSSNYPQRRVELPPFTFTIAFRKQLDF